MTAARFIDVRNLRRNFDVSKPWLDPELEGGHLEFLKAVDGVSFDIAEARPSRWSANPVPARPPSPAWSSGCCRRHRARVVIDGISMSAARQSQARQRLRRRIQMIFQDPYAA